MQNRKIVIAGAGITGLTYAFLLKQAGFDVEVYEKRPLSDLNKLDSLIYLREKTLEILSPFIDEEVFNKNNPNAFKEAANPTLFFQEPHANVNIRDLLEALIHAAERAGIPIHREYELIDFAKNGEGKTIATFLKDDQELNIECDQLLLACGNHDINNVLEGTPYNQPIDLHSTYILGSRMPVDLSNMDFTNKSSISILPEFKDTEFPMATFLFSQLQSLFVDEGWSIGFLSMYVASLTRFFFMSTLPPEHYSQIENNKAAQVDFVKDRFIYEINRLKEKYPKMEFDWLKEYINNINADNVGMVKALAKVHVPDKRLLQQNVALIGDALVTSPFIFGSEYNEHVTRAFPGLLDYLLKMREATFESERDQAINEYEEFLWNFILDEKSIGRYLRMSDMVGNTILTDGSKMNMSKSYGFPLSKENLIRINEENKTQKRNTVDMPEYQNGGWLTEQPKLSDEKASKENKTNGYGAMSHHRKLSMYSPKPANETSQKGEALITYYKWGKR